MFCACTHMTHACVPLQDKAAEAIHNKNRIYKRQLIGLLAKVMTFAQKHLCMHEVRAFLFWKQFASCVIQMVGATPEEVEAMGKEQWTGDHFVHATWHLAKGLLSTQLLMSKFCSCWRFQGKFWQRYAAIWTLSCVCTSQWHINTSPSLWTTNCCGHTSISPATGCTTMIHLCSYDSLVPKSWASHSDTQAGCPDTLCHTLKQVCLYVSSPYFEFCHFLRRTPQIESLEFAHCPHFDVDSFVTSIKQCPLVQLCTLDLRGASSVSSMDLWEVTKHLPKLSKLFVDTPVSDIFAKEIFENLPNLTHFDCVAPNWCLEEWRSLVDKFHWVQLGPQLWVHL